MAIASISVILAVLAGMFLSRWVGVLVQERRKERRVRDKAFASGIASGADAGYARPMRRKMSKRRARELRRSDMERHVPEMIDAVALGMRAGLSFESAFSLYCGRFDDELATACRRACRSWESGLVTRDDALRGLAREVDVPTLTRFVNNVTRCLRFGSPMTRIFEVMAEESRSCYKAKMEELVAKAPVKMLMPTAVLILPAMLIVVMGPVLLEFL